MGTFSRQALTAALICVPLLHTRPANANSFTFTYTGQDYTSGFATNIDRTGLLYPFTQAELNSWVTGLGPHMTIKVTLKFLTDVSEPITGSFRLDGFEQRSALGFYVGTANFVSGSASGNSGSGGVLFSSISLVNGFVTGWNFDVSFLNSRSCVAPLVQYCEFQSSTNGGDHVIAYTGYNQAYFHVHGDAAGTWTSVPGPIVGAGLPGLVIALGGLVMLWRRRQALQA